jgi:hypothetical protein
MGVIPNGSSGLTPQADSFGWTAGGNEQLSFADRDQSAVTALLKSQKKSPLTSPFSGFSSAMISMFTSVVTGVTTGLSGALSTLATLVNMRWTQVDDHDTAIVDLQDKTQLLEGVIGYGCRYMSSGPGVTTSAETMNFDTQIGPAVGVTLRPGGLFRLDSKGLWRFEAQVYFQGASGAPPRCFMDIVIRNAAGAEFTRLRAMGSTDDPLTLTNVMPAVIPAAGYTAEVQAWTSDLPIIGGSWRSIGAGLGTTRFSVFKISSETA